MFSITYSTRVTVQNTVLYGNGLSSRCTRLYTLADDYKIRVRLLFGGSGMLITGLLPEDKMNKVRAFLGDKGKHEFTVERVRACLRQWAEIPQPWDEYA